jgi:hypothetical protein
MFAFVALLVAGCGAAPESGSVDAKDWKDNAPMSLPQPQSFTSQDNAAAYALRQLYYTRTTPLVVKTVIPFVYQGETVLQVQVGAGWQNDPSLSPERVSGYDYDTGGGTVHYKVEIIIGGTKQFVSIST